MTIQPLAVLLGIISSYLEGMEIIRLKMNNRKITALLVGGLVLILVLISYPGSVSHAAWIEYAQKSGNDIEVVPKDMPGWEDFTHNELIRIQKDYLDKGHQSWRSDPEPYGRMFMLSYYLQLDSGQPYFTLLDTEGERAVVNINYNNKQHAVYLHKVFPPNPKSAWIIDKMMITPRVEIESINLGKLKQIDKLLQNSKLTNRERAGLLSKKALLMLETFEESALRAATECLMDAVKLDPDNRQYKNYLAMVYVRYWERKDLGEKKDAASVNLRKLKNEVKKIVARRR